MSGSRQAENRSERSRSSQAIWPKITGASHRESSRKPVLGPPGPASQVDAHALRSQVDVPATFDCPGQLEAHRHVDALQEVRAHLAEAPEVLDKGIAELRGRVRIS